MWGRVHEKKNPKKFFPSGQKCQKWSFFGHFWHKSVDNAPAMGYEAIFVIPFELEPPKYVDNARTLRFLNGHFFDPDTRGQRVSLLKIEISMHFSSLNAQIMHSNFSNHYNPWEEGPIYHIRRKNLKISPIVGLLTTGQWLRFHV